MNKQEGLSPGKKKTLMALGWLAAILVVIGAPFGITAHHFHTIYHTTDQALLVLARLSGLMAMSLIFMEIVTGSFRPLLVKIYPRAALHRAHIAFGIAGLAFIVSHFLLLVPDLTEHWR